MCLTGVFQYFAVFVYISGCNPVFVRVKGCQFEEFQSVVICPIVFIFVLFVLLFLILFLYKKKTLFKEMLNFMTFVFNKSHRLIKLSEKSNLLQIFILILLVLNLLLWQFCDTLRQTNLLLFLYNLNEDFHDS